MKVFVRTWRFGQDTTVAMHGKGVEYDSAAHLLIVRRPVLDSGLGDAIGYTITAGDEWTTELCGADCSDHPGEAFEITGTKIF